MDSSKPSVALNGFILALALAALGGGGYWLFFSGSDSSDGPLPGSPEATWLALDTPFTFASAQLVDVQSARRDSLPDIEIGADEEGLLETFYEQNEQSAAGDVTEAQLAALSELIISMSVDYGCVHGAARFEQLGWRLVDEFVASVERVIEMARSSGEQPADIVRGDSEDARYIRERVGNFFDFASEAGLLDEDGELAYDASFLAVMFRVRWFSFAEEATNRLLLTPFEHEVFWRWRLETLPSLNLNQRLALLDEIEGAYTDVGANAMRGLLAYRAGELERALVFFTRAAEEEPDNVRFDQYRQYVEAQLPPAPPTAQ